METINAISYLRILALSMILYDHLGAMRSQEWFVKKILDFLFCAPLNIIQEFGALGVSLFYLITGYLFLYANQNRKKCVRYYIKKLVKLYSYVILSFMVFGVFQWILNFFHPVYWSQFSLRDWAGCASLFYHFNGTGEMINGTTWFLLPLAAFYLTAACCHSVLRKNALYGILLMEGILTAGIVLGEFLQEQGISVYVRCYMPYIFIPVMGVILYVLLQKGIPARQGIGLIILNYSLMTAAFYKLNAGYFSDEPYIISVVYAAGLFLCFILGENHFKSNPYVDYFGKISLSVYLVHMTWGGLFMSFLESRIRFTAAFSVSVSLVVTVAVLHYYVIEAGILRRF